MASRPATALSQSLKQNLYRPYIMSQSYICTQCRSITSQALGAPGQIQIQMSTRTRTRAPATTPKYPTSKSIPAQYRTFNTSPRTLKKSSTNPKSSRKSPPIDTPSNPNPIPDNKHTRNLDSEPDPYDHSALSTAIDTAISRLKESLTKTRDAGRVSTSMLEDLPVDLLNQKSGGSSGGGGGGGAAAAATAHKTRTTVRDIASVAPRGGRTMQIFLSEEPHVKPVTSAVQASPYSLTPTVDPQNPLLLIVPVPPATAETRKQAETEAKKCFDKASLEVRNARGDAQKRHKKMEQLKVVVPDELRKAHKGMEEVAKRGQDEVKKVFDNAVKALHNV